MRARPMGRGTVSAHCPPLPASPADSYPRDVTELLQVYSATPSRESAMALVQSAVESRLAAGGQVYGQLA